MGAKEANTPEGCKYLSFQTDGIGRNGSEKKPRPAYGALLLLFSLFVRVRASALLRRKQTHRPRTSSI